MLRWVGAQAFFAVVAIGVWVGGIAFGLLGEEVGAVGGWVWRVCSPYWWWLGIVGEVGVWGLVVTRVLVVMEGSWESCVECIGRGDSVNKRH